MLCAKSGVGIHVFKARDKRVNEGWEASRRNSVVIGSSASLQRLSDAQILNAAEIATASQMRDPDIGEIDVFGQLSAEPQFPVAARPGILITAVLSSS